METWYAEILSTRNIVWSLVSNSLDSFQNNLLSFFYHGHYQQIPICWTAFTDIFHGKESCIAIFGNRYNPNVEVVSFSSSKNQIYHFLK